MILQRNALDLPNQASPFLPIKDLGSLEAKKNFVHAEDRKNSHVVLYQEPDQSNEKKSDSRKDLLVTKQESDTKSCHLSHTSEMTPKAPKQVKPKKKSNRIELTDEQMREEKAKLKKLYDNPPSSDDFEIVYEKAKRKNRVKRSFKCTYNGCNRKFAKTWNLFDHLRTHTGERPFVCGICDKAFAQNGNLTKHMKVHQGSERE